MATITVDLHNIPGTEAALGWAGGRPRHRGRVRSDGLEDAGQMAAAGDRHGPPPATGTGRRTSIAVSRRAGRVALGLATPEAGEELIAAAAEVAAAEFAASAAERGAGAP